MTEDHLSRLARLEVHLQHVLKAIEFERSARISLRAEVIHLHESQQKEIDEQRKDREALIRRIGGWVIYGLAALAGVLASNVLNLGSPEGVLGIFTG